MSVLEKHSFGTSSGSSITLAAGNTFTTVPDPLRDDLILLFASEREPGRSVVSVTGMGATWDRAGFVGDDVTIGNYRMEVWRGRGPNSAGSVSLTQSGSGFGQHMHVLLLRDEDVDNIVTAIGNQNAGLGQLVLSMGLVIGSSAAAVVPSSPTPALGWVAGPAVVNSTIGDAEYAYRYPTEQPQVAHNAGATGGTAQRIMTVVIGTYVAPPPPIPEGAGRLVWGANGEKRWETGVSQAVLYPPGGLGVPWNGIVSIDEQTVGGDVDEMYFDGLKYRSVVQNEDFQGILTAFSAPAEFAECDGRKMLAAGLFATHQPRKMFSLAYKTLLGNDLLQDKLGYKLHLVYNCMASPAQRSNKTKSNTPELQQLQWQLNCKPPWYGTNATYRSTAHFVIDSTLVDPEIMAALEDELYGTDITEPRMPTQTQVINILEG